VSVLTAPPASITRFSYGMTELRSAEGPSEAIAEEPEAEPGEEEEPADGETEAAEGEDAAAGAIWMWMRPVASVVDPRSRASLNTAEPRPEQAVAPETGEYGALEADVIDQQPVRAPLAETRGEQQSVKEPHDETRGVALGRGQRVVATTPDQADRSTNAAAETPPLDHQIDAPTSIPANRGFARAADVAQASERSAVARYREQHVVAPDAPEQTAEVIPFVPAEFRRSDAVLATSRGLLRVAPEPALDFAAADAAMEPVAALSAPPARIAGSEETPLVADTRLGSADLEKYTQTIEQQLVIPVLRSLGIDPAKVSSTMEFVAPDRSPLTAEVNSAEAPPTFAAGAARTVEQVLHAADLMRASERSGVQLRLDFGESGPLNVQITLRQGRVHTFFRSDSADVRNTLAQAWDSFAHRGDIAVLPLAEPVMLPLRSNLSSATGEGGRFSGSFSQSDADSRSGRESRDAREGSPLAAPSARRRSSRPVTSTPIRESAKGHLSVHA
jgi:hypothetical protein